MVIVTAQEPIQSSMIQPGELLNTSLGWDGSLLWVLPPPLNNMSDFPDNLPPPIYTPV